MVDVGGKAETERVAEAVGVLITAPETIEVLERHEAPKGDPLVVAQIAGIQAAKRTSELIPLCHQLPLTRVSVHIDIDKQLPGIRVHAEARVVARTGVEMEALTAVSVAALTVYDMCKAIDRGMVVSDIRLVRKSGGKSWVFEAR